MKSNNQNGQDVKDIAADAAQEVNRAQIKVWAKADLERSITFLTAVAQDDSLLEMMAQWFEGRIQNHKNKEAANKEAQ